MPQEPELRWVDGGAAETRADVCQVQSSREETMLLFGARQADNPRALLRRRIVINPLLAKQLAASLGRAVRALEASQGSENATPAGHLQSAADEEDAPVAARPMLARVRELGTGFGFEKSFKLGPGRLLEDRVIFGVRTARTSAAEILRVCRGIGMPSRLQERFAEALPQANTVGFGHEGGADGGVFKVYLEFWDRLWERLRREPGNAAPDTLFLGFKWNARNGGQDTVARYTCHPLLPVEGILRRLDALYEAHRDSPSLLATRAILAQAASRVGADTFVYVEAEEEGNPRRSYDLNLYKARLRVADLQPALADLCARYGVPEESLARAGAGPRAFGHLSGGLGRDGEDFLTVYYELEGI